MIENTKKILRKLISDVERYQVSLSFKNPHVFIGCYALYTIIFEKDKISYILEIIEEGEKTRIKWRNNFGSVLYSDIDPDWKYEILDLCQKLKRECENYTSTMFRNFADESVNEPDDDLE